MIRLFTLPHQAHMISIGFGTLRDTASTVVP